MRGREVPLLLSPPTSKPLLLGGAAAGRALAWHTPASARSHPEGGSAMPCHYRWWPGPWVAMVLCFWPGSAHSEAQRAPSGWVGLGAERPQAPRSTLHRGVVSAHCAPLRACAATHLPRGVHLQAPRLDEGLPASDSEEPPTWGVPRAKCFLQWAWPRLCCWGGAALGATRPESPPASAKTTGQCVASAAWSQRARLACLHHLQSWGRVVLCKPWCWSVGCALVICPLCLPRWGCGPGARAPPCELLST